MTGGTPATNTGGTPAPAPAPTARGTTDPVPAPAPAPAPAARTVVFASAPNLGTNILDYSDKAGIKAFEKATKALKSEYDGGKSNVAVFKEQLSDHAQVNGWAGKNNADIINIPTDGTNRALGTKDLIHEYSQLSKTTITTWALNNIVGKATRAYQNNYNMVMCLNASMTDDCRARMSLKKANYTVGQVEIAALLYKELLKRAEVDTKASCAVTRLELYCLDAKMIEVNYDINKFVAFVEECETKLAAHGETVSSEDLLLNIFKALLVVKDKKYREKMEKLKDDWLNSEVTLTSAILLSKAESSYNVRIEQSDWMALSPEEEKIVAMQATYDNQIKDLRLQLKAAKQGGNRRSQGRSNTNNNNGNEDNGNKPRTSTRYKDAEWKMTNSKGLKTQQRNGKTYYWCLHHNDGKGKWVLHKLEDCKNAEADKAKDDSDTKSSAKVMAAVDDGGEENDYSDDDTVKSVQE